MEFPHRASLAPGLPLLRNLLWLPSTCWRTALLPFKWGGAPATAPLTTPLPQVPALRQKGHGACSHPVGSTQGVQRPLGRPPQKWSPRSRAWSFPGAGGTSVGRPPAQRVSRVQLSLTSLGVRGSCAHIPSRPGDSGSPAGPWEGPGDLPDRAGLGAQPRSAPRPPPSCPPLAALSLPSNLLRPPPRASSTRASPASLSHAASSRLQPQPHPGPLSGLSRAAPSCPPTSARWCPWSPLPQAQTGWSCRPRGLSPGWASGGASTTRPRGLAPCGGRVAGMWSEGRGCRAAGGWGRCLSGSPGFGEQLGGVGMGPRTGEGTGGPP